MSAACASFVFGLDVADGWFAPGKAQHALIVSAEKYSLLLDWKNRSTCILESQREEFQWQKKAHSTISLSSCESKTDWREWS
ncbi:MAG: hypothetical protein LIV22_05970 [Olegusella sp.]|nr:hypothetical protein [Olegusella sp.]